MMQAISNITMVVIDLPFYALRLGLGAQQYPYSFIGRSMLEWAIDLVIYLRIFYYTYYYTGSCGQDIAIAALIAIL